jgi:hypothetical protein
LSSAFYLDGKIMNVSGAAELLFVRLLAVCSATSSGGIFNIHQVTAAAGKMRTPMKSIQELVAADLILPLPNFDPVTGRTGDLDESIRSPSEPIVSRYGVGSESVVSGYGVDSESVVSHWRVRSYGKWNQYNDVSAGSGDARINGHASSSRGRGPAREERKKEREEVRPASQDGRTSSAQDAPRGGAARPAQDQNQPRTPGWPGQAEPDRLLERADHPALAVRRQAAADADAKGLTGWSKSEFVEAAIREYEAEQQSGNARGNTASIDNTDVQKLKELLGERFGKKVGQQK